MIFNETALTGKLKNLLLNPPAILTDDEIFGHIAPYFSRAAEFLALADKFGTPLYVIDSAAIASRVSQFMNAFAGLAGMRIYYPVKTNSCPQVVREMINCGCGIEVSSGQELAMVLGLGSQDIIFNGPGKQADELRLAVKNHSCVRVLVDSFEELSLLGRLAGEAGCEVNIGVRVTSGPSWKKFGIPPSKLCEFIDCCDAFAGVRLEGIQFHTSWNMNPSAQVAFLSVLGDELKKLSATHRNRIKFLDIGGGFWPEQGEWLTPEGTALGRVLKELAPELLADDRRRFRIPAVPIEDFAGAITTGLREYVFPYVECGIYAEPGRWLINSGMHILIKVLDVKDGGNMVITCGGINAVGWERFETDYCPVLNLSSPAPNRQY
ncbi:MAG TPA: alanine racemase, partial [Phycisphaerae bacterium]|nr:alanine racemase [Phycisphaerae bacterium]